MRKELLFVDAWEFLRQEVGTTPQTLDQAPDKWQAVDIPHDWIIHDTHDLYATGEGWYRKDFCHPEPDSRGQRTSFRFEGVYMDSTIFINRRQAFEWKGGYSSFEFDATDFLQPGNNQILLRCRHQTPNSRWYAGSGIYRKVWMKLHPATHLAADGVYIVARPGHVNSPVQTDDEYPPASLPTASPGPDWTVRVSTEVRLAAPSRGLTVRQVLLDPWGREIARAESGLDPHAHGRPPAGPDAVSGSPDMLTHRTSLAVQDPSLWCLENPALYRLQTTLVRDGETLDQTTRTFGFRTIHFHPSQGFRLNGRKIKLKGVCQHHDLGCLGAAVNKAALRRQFTLLRTMGVNAIRTAHNMPAVEFMELADEMGFLVCSESFDMWEKPKTDWDFARFFPEWAERETASWVRRDRNCPSLIMWSIGNEIYDTHAGPRGQELTRWLMDLVHQHDPDHNAWVTLGSNYMPWEGAQNCADIVKLAGYNYGEKFYARHHEMHPDWIIYGSETSSIVQSRGIYHFPASRSMLADDDQQCSALGNSATSWGARSVEACICADRDTPFSLGQFLWSGFDYIGEPTPYHTKNSYFGQIDTAGFPKDPYYLYQAEWTDWRTAPMVHIYPYWDFNPGQLIDVRVCSNAPRVELFFNHKSLGTFDIDHQTGQELQGKWQIPWEAGTLEARAYDPDGKVIATDSVSDFGDAAALVLHPDRTTLKADGEDLVFVEITAADSQGRPVANANNRVEVTVTGAGRLVGLDNGDSTDYDQYKGTSRRLFSGKLLAVIAPRPRAGTVEVQVSSPGLKPACLSLQTIPAPLPPGLPQGWSPVEENRPDPAVAARGETGSTPECSPAVSGSAVPPDPSGAAPGVEIPVRKIELHCPSGRAFSPGLTTLPVEARIHPANATWQALEWRVCNDAGIDSNIAKVSASGKTATVTASGDGQFRLRCATRNGGGHISLISQIEFTVSGLGKATLDPYALVSGGLYSRSNVELGNGNERGVATPRDGESHVCFDGVDFGDWGADEITIPLFALDSERFPIEIWEGMPGEPGSELLADVSYQKKSIWNTYQEETWKLRRRIRGLSSLCFVLRRKVHIKGFWFKPINKAFQTISALENSRIYGDSFETGADSITGIGNNVSLEFHHMDFGPAGTSQLVICGRSSLEKNTIHIRFETQGGEIMQLAEFPYSDDWVERTFDLERVCGECKVTLVFLPGSKFDLKWIRFG